MPTDPDIRRLRGLLAERRITRKQFAAACGLNHTFVSRVLCGAPVGELGRIKLRRGAETLHLNLESDAEVQRAS